MSVTAYSELHLNTDHFGLESAKTLQDLLRVSRAIFERLDINHAVLLYMPSPAHSLALPLLPIEPSLQDILLKAVRSNMHPAVRCEGTFGQPKALSDFRTSSSNEPMMTKLMRAFREAGMRQVYELPLAARNDVHFVLEVSRFELPIGDIDLAELQSIASIIPGKLPEFLINPPSPTFKEPELRVR